MRYCAKQLPGQSSGDREPTNLFVFMEKDHGRQRNPASNPMPVATLSQTGGFQPPYLGIIQRSPIRLCGKNKPVYVIRLVYAQLKINQKTPKLAGIAPPSKDKPRKF